MNKNLYGLLLVGVTSVFIACYESDNALIGGTSEEPNMITAEGDSSFAPVRCRRVGNSKGLSQDGCYWSGEMWNRNSGYRVRTGFDNGTNTSGIWYWTVEPMAERNVYIDWDAPASDEYDSLALAKVIDQCNGSLCGTAVFDELKESCEGAYCPPTSFVSLRFSFAGKNSSGKFDNVNVIEKNGICIEYTGSMQVELVLSDSLQEVLQGWSYSVTLPNYGPIYGHGIALNGNEICFPWGYFGGSRKTSVPFETVLSNVQGLRFKIRSDFSKQTKLPFNIISLGWYSGAPAERLHPVVETCEPASVLEYYCDCSFTEERAEYDSHYKLLVSGLQMGSQDSTMSMSARECLNKGVTNYLDALSPNQTWERPCENPLPKTIFCTDGTISESQEFSEMWQEYEKKVDVFFEQTKKSVFDMCLTLRDVYGNGDTIPDTCRREGPLFSRDFSSLMYTTEALTDAYNEFYGRMDSLYLIDSLDENTRYCVSSNLRAGSPHRSASLNGRQMMPYFTKPSMVKYIRCESGNVYYTDEYKEFLEEVGIQDDTDSLQVYTVAREHYLKQREMVFDYCLETDHSNELIYNYGAWSWNGGDGGDWVVRPDTAAANRSTIQWPVEIGNAYDDNSLEPVIDACEGICGHVILDADSLEYDPYVDIVVNVGGYDSNGVALPADISSWGGICIEYASTLAPVLLLDPGESLTLDQDYDLPYVQLVKSTNQINKCVEWADFTQVEWGGNGKITGEKIAKKTVRIVFRIQAKSGTEGEFFIYSLRKKNQTPDDVD